MIHKRKFIIQITGYNETNYISEIYKNAIGYYFGRTANKKKAKVWKFKKNCQNNIDKLIDKLDPTKRSFLNCSLEIIEITDNTTLRSIKLKKLNKNGDNDR
jgi:hypothetical protein